MKAHITREDEFKVINDVNEILVKVLVAQGEKGDKGDNGDISVVKVNGTEITPVAGAVDVPVPTKTSDLQNDSGFLTEHQDISGKENISNKVTSISSSSTDTQYPSAKAIYDNYASKDYLENGKNLFSSNIEQGRIAGGGNEENDNAKVRSRDIIYLDAGTYTINANGVNNFNYHIYSTSGVWEALGSNTWLTLPYTFTLTQRKGIRFVFKKSDDSNITPSSVSNIMLNKGSTALPYEEYYGKYLNKGNFQNEIEANSTILDNFYEIRKIVYGKILSIQLSKYFGTSTTKISTGETVVANISEKLKFRQSVVAPVMNQNGIVNNLFLVVVNNSSGGTDVKFRNSSGADISVYGSNLFANVTTILD